MKLELRSIACGYDGRSILKNISFAIKGGEILYILGPNGAGKTTLLKTISGLLKPQGGQILFDGQSTEGWPPSRLAAVFGYIPQAHQCIFPFKVLDVVLMGRTVHLSPFKAPAEKDIQIARKAMEILDIGHLEQRVYPALSEGEKQLVLIARALAQEPKILIMDEPTSHLDFGNQVKVLTRIQHLAELGLAIVISSHFPDHALIYGTKVLLLEKESGFYMGKPDQIITEERLKNAYGIDVRIVSLGWANGKELKTVLPSPASPETKITRHLG